MKKRYIVTAATAIAASLTIGCAYGPAPDHTMYTPDDEIAVESIEPEEPAADKTESFDISSIPENTIDEIGDPSEKDDTGR